MLIPCTTSLKYSFPSCCLHLPALDLAASLLQGRVVRINVVARMCFQIMKQELQTPLPADGRLPFPWRHCAANTNKPLGCLRSLSALASSAFHRQLAGNGAIQWVLCVLASSKCLAAIWGARHGDILSSWEAVLGAEHVASYTAVRSCHATCLATGMVCVWILRVQCGPSP